MCGWGEVGKGNTIAHGFSIDVVSLQHIECHTCGSNMKSQTYVVSLQQEGQLLYILLRQDHQPSEPAARQPAQHHLAQSHQPAPHQPPQGHLAQAHLGQSHQASVGHSAVDVC